MEERDAWIAATGLVRGPTIVTCNIADFAGTGAVLLHSLAATAERLLRCTIGLYPIGETEVLRCVRRDR